jgi:hypothetical protein
MRADERGTGKAYLTALMSSSVTIRPMLTRVARRERARIRTYRDFNVLTWVHH